LIIDLLTILIIGVSKHQNLQSRDDIR